MTSQRSVWIRDAVVVLKIFLLLAIPTSLLLFHVHNQYRITQVGYELASVTSQHRALLEENKKLTVEARVQGRTDRVAALARQQFGLVETRPEQVITVELPAKKSDDPRHASLDAGSAVLAVH